MIEPRGLFRITADETIRNLLLQMVDRNMDHVKMVFTGLGVHITIIPDSKEQEFLEATKQILEK